MQALKLISSTFIILLFATAALSGLYAAMTTDGHGNMAPCPFMNGGSLCSMNLIQHISAWQSLFVATTPTIIILFLVLTLLVASISANVFERNYFTEIQSSAFQNRDFSPHLFDPLRLAFSKGILHPKRHNRIVIS